MLVKSVVILLGMVATADAAELIVRLPSNETIHAANAVERGSQIVQPGKIDGSSAHFGQVRAGAILDLAIEEKSGAMLCGADLSWCDPTPADPQAEALGDDDKAAIAAIVKDILGFANKPSIVQLVGDHDRAIALVSLVRDNGFHSNSGDEVIWRAEVWFFQWENGGWARVPNQSRILRRDRFATHADFQKEIDRVRWIPELGGVHINGDGQQLIDLSKTNLNPPATTASDSAAGSHPTTPVAH